MTEFCFQRLLDITFVRAHYHDGIPNNVDNKAELFSLVQSTVDYC